MKVTYQNILKLAFVSLFFIFPSCSKSDSNTDENEGKQFHSYDLEFNNNAGSNTFQYTYAGSEISSSQSGMFDESMGNFGALTMNLTHGTNKILGGFILSENGTPLNLNYEGNQTFEASLLELHDSALNRIFKGVSGTVTIISRDISESSNSPRAANYKLQFEGEFDLFLNGAFSVRCTGTGEIAVGQPIP